MLIPIRTAFVLKVARRKKNLVITSALAKTVNIENSNIIVQNLTKFF